MGGRSFLVTEVTDDDPAPESGGGISLPTKAAIAALVAAFFLLNSCGAHEAPAPAPTTTAATTHS